MNASPRGKIHQRPEARRLRVLSVLANGAERGSRPGSGFPSQQDWLLRSPGESVRRASLRPLQRAPPRRSSQPPANHHPHTEHYLPGAGRPRVHLAPSPTPGSEEGDAAARGPRRRRGGPRAGAGATALTFPGPPGWRRVIQQGPGRRRRARGWRRGELGPRWRPLQTSTATLDTHQATFWEPDSPPATAAAATATAPAPASVMAGAALRASERARAREGRFKGMGEETEKGGGGEGRGEGRRGDGEEEKGEK